MHRSNIKSLLLMLLLLAACGTSVEDTAMTMIAETEESLAPFRTETAVAANVTSTQDAVNVAETSAVQATETRIFKITATAQEKADVRATQNAEREMLATQAAEPIFNIIQSMYDDSYLTRNEGEYVSLPDFSATEAQLNFFYPYPINYAPSNFVISTSVKWDSASDKANWWNSGCGFLFRIGEDFDNFYGAFLMHDGYVEINRWVNGRGSSLANSYYNKIDGPTGEAKFTLAVENNKIHVFVNDKHIVSGTDSRFRSGYFAYTLSSGTNAGFGTACDFTDTSLWLFDGEEPLGNDNNSNGN